MPDRTKAMTQTKMDNLVLQVGVRAWGGEVHPIKSVFLYCIVNLQHVVQPDDGQDRGRNM